MGAGYARMSSVPRSALQWDSTSACCSCCRVETSRNWKSSAGARERRSTSTETMRDEELARPLLSPLGTRRAGRQEHDATPLATACRPDHDVLQAITTPVVTRRAPLWLGAANRSRHSNASWSHRKPCDPSVNRLTQPR
jgi:hypothetical protein